MGSEQKPRELDAVGEILSVLIVDDESDLRMLVRKVLERSGQFTVVGEASSGLEAVTSAEQHQPDIITLDLMMPTPGEESMPHLLRVAPRCMITVFSSLVGERLPEHLQSLGAFSCHPKTALAELPERLAEDYRRFSPALDGEDTAVAWRSSIDPE